MAAKKKVIATVAAVATSAALLLGGTMAWQSANQVALNEASDVINPGGRLHDDFNGENKDVYVENFADDPIYARVRLEEYFEIITNYTEDGTSPEKVHTIVGERLELAADEDPAGLNVRYAVNKDGTTGEPLYVRDYDIHVFTEEELNNAAVKTEDNGTSYAWWNWQLGGETIYMPTYNLNKDSLLADVNGVFDGAVGTITDKNPADPYAQYQDENFPYVEYTDGEAAYGYEVYDGDPNDADEIKDSIALKDIIKTSVVPTEFEGAVELTDEEVPHYAKSTLKAELISMEDWLQMLEDNGGYDASLGNYWVYDEDGWVYWSAPIEPDTATGLLLDGIKLNQVMDDTWYYAINVVAQFITADDMGKTDGTGFYDKDMGYEPTTNALTLLKAIGVEVPITTQAELQAAFEQGGTITLPDVEITSDEAKDVGLNVKFAYSWTEGGTLNGGTLNDTSGAYAGLFINNENNWPADGDGASDATVNDTEISSNSDFAVYVQAIDAPATLNNMKVRGENGGVYAEYSKDNNTVTLNNLDVVAGSKHSTDWVNTAVAAANGANVEINGGTYEGNYAAYVYSTGGTIEINGGTFTGALRVDAGSIIITGGTFTVDPSEYVADGYEAVKNDDGTWSVQADTSDKTAPTVSTVVGNGLIYTYTITNVSDTDFPMTMHVYWADNDNVYSESVSALYTVNYALDEDGTVVQTGNGTGAHDANITYENGTITSVLNTVVEEDGYWGVTISDNAGNIGRLEQPITVTKVIGCFAAGTQVLTEEGLKNIEDITLGELVWSVNMETYQSELKPVTYVQGERYIDATYTLYVGGEKIVTTYEHPFYANGEWTAAEDLKAGDMLRCMDGTEVAIDKVVYTELAEPLRVYNFTVDENHCYIVSAQKLLVHNISK